MLTKERKKQEVEEKKEAEKNAKIFIYPGIYVFFFFFFFGEMVGWARARKIQGLLLEEIKVAAKPKKLSKKQSNDVLRCEPTEKADEQHP